MQLLKILSPPCASSIVALQIPRYSWQQAPSLGMELRKLDAAICYCRCLFFSFHIISSVEWKQAASYASDFTPGQCLCWIQQARESPCSAGKHCQRCSSHQSSQRDLACFVLWFCTELQQLPAVPRQRPAGILCSLSPGMLSPAFPAGSTGRRSSVLPVLAVACGIEAGCRPWGGGEAAWPGTLLLVAAVGWSQTIHGKLGESVVLLRVSVVEHDFSFWWRVFF